MIRLFIKFYFNRSSKNGVAIRKAIKQAMPAVKVKAKPEANIPASLRKVA